MTAARTRMPLEAGQDRVPIREAFPGAATTEEPGFLVPGGEMQPVAVPGRAKAGSQSHREYGRVARKVLHPGVAGSAFLNFPHAMAVPAQKQQVLNSPASEPVDLQPQRQPTMGVRQIRRPAQPLKV